MCFESDVEAAVWPRLGPLYGFVRVLVSSWATPSLLLLRQALPTESVEFLSALMGSVQNLAPPVDLPDCVV